MPEPLKPLNKIILKYSSLILFFFLLCGIAYRLLFLGQIGPTEFVALVIGAIFSCLVINFIDDIQEFSIGGNIFKLKEINNKSEKLLNDLQVEYFKMRIAMAFAPTNFWDGGGSSVYSSRIDFYNVIKDIKKEGLLNHPELREKIESQLTKSLQHQFEDILRIGDVLDVNPFTGVLDPLTIRYFISEEIIKKSIRKQDQKYQDEIVAKKSIFERIEIYENLFKAQKWLEE